MGWSAFLCSSGHFLSQYLHSPLVGTFNNGMCDHAFKSVVWRGPGVCMTPPPLPSPCKPFLVTLNKTQHEVRNDNLVSTLCLTQCDPPFRKILVMLMMYMHLQLLVQATTNGLFKFDPSTGLTTFCFFLCINQ